MKTYLSILILLFSIVSCHGQSNNISKLDTIPFDLTKVEIYRDSIFFDCNNDNKKDLFLRFKYKYKQNPPIGESGQIIALYINSANAFYTYKTNNKFILSLMYSEIKQIDNKSFVIINEGSGQDWNRYYCYFLYDDILKDWFLYRNEVYRAYYEKGKDTESLNLISKEDYQENHRSKFSEVSFVKLFQKFLEEIPDPPYYEKIKIDRATIFSEPEVKTAMYLIKGDEVKIVKEKGEYLKIYFFGKKRIEGWIKKSDVE